MSKLRLLKIHSNIEKVNIRLETHYKKIDTLELKLLKLKIEQYCEIYSDKKYTKKDLQLELLKYERISCELKSESRFTYFDVSEKILALTSVIVTWRKSHKNKVKETVEQ